MCEAHRQDVLRVLRLLGPCAECGVGGDNQGGSAGDGQDADGDSSAEGNTPAEPRDRPSFALQLQRGSREGEKVQVIILYY